MVSKVKTTHTYHNTQYNSLHILYPALLQFCCRPFACCYLSSLRYLRQGPPSNRMNKDVFGRIIDYGGEEGSFLFVNMVCKSWVKVHGEQTKYTTTSAIMTSHPRLAWAVDAGWDGGDKALAFQLAVASGSAEMVDLVAEKYPPGHNAKTYEDIKDGVEQAAAVGALAMMQRLWRIGVQFGGEEENITLLESAAQIAIYNGHTVVSEWCVKTTWNAVRYIAIDTVMALMKQFSACRPLLQWLHQEGGLADRIYSNHVPAEGARQGLLDSVLWCLEHRWEYSDAIMATAARAGHLHVVRGLRARDYRWGMDICMQAARSGNLELLEWCLLNGCPWSWPKVVDAARNDDFGGVVQLDVVQWCIEVGGGEILVDGEWVPMVVVNST